MGQLRVSVIVVAALVGLPSARAEELRPHAAPAAALTNPLAVHPLDKLTATRERPLFSPTRRPPPPPVVAAAEPELPPPPPAPPALLLSGVVMDKKGALAIVRADESAVPTYVHVGDVISGWKVGHIDRRQLILSLDGRSATFTLFDHEKQTEQAGRPRHQGTARVLEVNAAGVLRSHRVETSGD